MGLDLLDLTFRAERAFSIRMPRDWVARLGITSRHVTATLEQYHDLLLQLCREQSRVPPADSWKLLQRIVADATGVEDATPTMTLRDIAPDG